MAVACLAQECHDENNSNLDICLGEFVFQTCPFFVMDSGYLIKGESKDVRVNLIFLFRVGVLKH